MKNSSKKLLTSADWDIDIQACSFDDSDIQACSATDCTGLIPALPETDAELEHYQELYHYLPDSPDQTADDSDHYKS